jgi:hypothetical protein
VRDAATRKLLGSPHASAAPCARLAGGRHGRPKFGFRLLISTLLLVAVLVAAPRAQQPRNVTGEWTVTLEFPELQLKETLTLKFRPGVGLDPSGRLRRGYQAVRERPELGSNNATVYFLRMADRRIRMSVDRQEMCDVVFESNDSFSGRCNMIGIVGTIAARRNAAPPN